MVTFYSQSSHSSAAQRAFRERKQSQLAELQARVNSYEQGEIERNVALQSIAKRLKEENETLRHENTLLKQRILRIEKEHWQQIASENDKKRWRDDSLPSNSATVPLTNKRSKAFCDAPDPAQLFKLAMSHTPSPSPVVSSPGSSDTRFSSLPPNTQPDKIQTSLDLPSNVNLAPSQTFDCGFCNEDTPCVCREVATQQSAGRIGTTRLGDYSQTDVHAHAPNSIHPGSGSIAPGSILDNLPAYQPPVLLRRRPSSSSVSPIFLSAASSGLQYAPSASCSGDPSDCVACAGDAFGRAFCTAIESITTQSLCADCPCNEDKPFSQDKSSSASHINCCVEFPDCSCRAPASNVFSVSTAMTDQAEPETMPTNDAWRQLKAHPNVAFADLSLLAEVVARRSKCTGPQVVISPALGSVTPERMLSPPYPPLSDNDQVLLIDPRVHHHEEKQAQPQSNGPSPTLGPQDVLVRCGRQRVREVQTDAVRAALRLLDSKIS